MPRSRALLLLPWLAAACGRVAIPAVGAARPAPGYDEVYLLAFAAHGPRYAVLEHAADAPLQVALYDPVTHEREALALEGGWQAALEPWPADRAELLRRLTGDDGPAAAVAAALAARGLSPARLAAPEAAGLAVRLDGGRAQVGDGDEAVALGEVPDADPEAAVWLVSADGARLAVELAFAGEPRSRGVWVFPVAAAAAQVWSRRAYARHLAGDYPEAEARWRRSAGLDPGNGDTWYDLACAAARQGHLDDARAALDEALRRDRERYARLAADDPDLEALRGGPEHVQNLAWPSVD